MPKISVLIPAYNVELYIRECIDSVLNQTMQDFEIVCVDDASTDGTLHILEEYQKKDDRIKVYRHEKNQGQSSGRNDALSHATGEYVYMLDADDRIVPNMFEELYPVCSRDKLDVVGFETKNFTDDPTFDENVRIKTITYKDTDVMNGREALIYIIENESVSVSMPTFMIRRDYLNEKNIRFVEGILHEDVGYSLELIVRADKVRFIHKTYFERRIRGNSTMTKGFTEKNIEGYLKSFYKSFEIEDSMKGLFDDERLKAAMGKWQRDIYARLNQLMRMVVGEDEPTESKTAKDEDSDAGFFSKEIKRALETVKILHYRTQKLDISECYLCGIGAYTERAIEAVGAQNIIIRGIIVLDKTAPAFRGFPVVSIDEADKNIPVVLSVSRYTKDEYREAVEANGNRIIEIFM